MVLLSVQKLARPLKFSSRPERNHHHRQTSAAAAAALRNFRSKISARISQQKGPHKCFELIHTTNRAFAELAVEIDYPSSRWSGKLADEYLTHTMNLLDLLNSVNSAASHLTQAVISVHHAVTLVEKSPQSAAQHLKKIQIQGKGFKIRPGQRSIGIGERRALSDDKEIVVLQALILSKRIGFLVLGFVLSGLCSDDAEIYLEIGKSFVDDDSLIKDLDLRLLKEVRGMQGIVEEVNRAIERLAADLSTGSSSCGEAAAEVKMRLEILENSIQGVEKEADNLFSQVLGARNKLLDNLRLTGHSN